MNEYIHIRVAPFSLHFLQRIPMSLISINRNPSRTELRQFACIWCPAFCALAGFLIYRKTGLAPLVWSLWSVATAMELAGLIAPKIVKPIFVGLMFATFPIGWVVSHILLMVAFYLILTPIGLLMRLFGHDSMQRKFDRSRQSYWIARPPTADAKRYFKQY